MTIAPRADGYITDVPYVRSFIRELTPAWLDHAALVAGFVPPDRKESFAWCDLGCGHGVTAAVLAATHSAGSFHGIDAMPLHIDFAQRLAVEAAIPNVSFKTTDFETAAEVEYSGFDYIVSHGVYSWVDEQTRRSWRHFIDRHLRPGGLVYVSYNAMPGRAADLPYQRLVRALGRSLPGNSQERVAAAMVFVNSMTGLKAPALAASPLAASVQDHGDRFKPPYLAHELMNGNWEPLCVTDVRAALAEIGLKPAGSATLIDNHDSFVLGSAAREVLAEIVDEDVRELARDYFIDQFFRRDVFIREGQRLSPGARRKRLMENVFFLAQSVEAVEYSLKTPAGKLGFDNTAARHIVSALSSGPRRLAEIADPAIPERDLIANLLVLSAARTIWPVNDVSVSVSRLNAAILGRLGRPDEINCLALPFGTALPASRELLMRMPDRENLMDDPAGGWVQSVLTAIGR
jgi:SAM-dependent methyltransferase